MDPTVYIILTNSLILGNTHTTEVGKHIFTPFIVVAQIRRGGYNSVVNR